MKLRSFRLALLPAIFLFLAACQTTQQPDPASRITVLEGATVIDGVSDAPIEDAILVIEGDTIRNVGRRGSFEVPENAARINATGKTIMPGYYSNETDVRRIPRRSWIREDHALVLAVSDKRTGRYLVLHMRGTEPTPLRLTRVWPKPAAPGKAKVEAETSTVTLPGVGTEWSVVVVPITAFNEEGAERGKRMVPANRSRLVRLELGATEKGAGVELRSALWADHRPTASSEEVR